MATMECEICLVRHGLTDWNRERRIQGHTDVPLNAEGLQQARLTAQRLAAERWSAVYSSDLRRAAQTAEIVGAALSLPVTFDRGLRERSLGPVLEGLTVVEARARVPEYWLLSEARGDRLPPGLEASDSLRARAVDALERIAAAHPGRRLVAVTHGGLINAFLAAISGGAIGSGKTRLDNGGLTRVRRLAGAAGPGAGWRVDSVNDTGHIPARAAEAAG